MKTPAAIAATLTAKLDVIRARGIVTDPTTKLPQACGLSLSSTAADVLATARMLHSNAQAAVALQKERDPRYGARKAEKAARQATRLARKAAAEEQRIAARAERQARKAAAERDRLALEARRAEAHALGYLRACNPDRLAALSEDATRFNLARVEAGVQLPRDPKGRVLGGAGLIFPEHLAGMDVAAVRAEITRNNALHLPSPPAADPVATTIAPRAPASSSSPRLRLSQSPRIARVAPPRVQSSRSQHA